MNKLGAQVCNSYHKSASSASGVYGGGNRIPSKLNGNDVFPYESPATDYDDSGLNPDDPPF